MSVFHNNVLSGAAGQAGGAAAFSLEKSVRFNRPDSANLSRTFAAGNRKTFTLSWWMKSCSYTNNARIFAKGLSAQQFSIMHSGVSDDRRRFYCYFNLDSPTDVSTLTFTGEHRDFSSWAHYCIAFDTTQATDSDRIKFYYNGVQQTDFIGTPNWPTQNASFKWNNSGDTYYIGGISTYRIDAYLADMYHIDGQQLDCTSFGEFDDNGVWQAKDASDLTFGTNGFHLFDFANESTVGHDSSGNENDWTVTNISSNSSPVYSNYVSGYNNSLGSEPTTNLFDGDTSTSFYSSTTSGSGIKFVPPTDITGSIELYLRNGDTVNSTFSYSLDNGSTFTNLTTTAGNGSYVSIGSQTISNTNGIIVRHITTDGTNSVNWRAIRVDSSVLTDGSGADLDVLRDVPKNGSADDDTGAGGEVSGNYCTFNPNDSNQTHSNGNLEVTSAGNTSPRAGTGTIAVSSGKWYWEVTVSAISLQKGIIGVVEAAYDGNGSSIPNSSSNGVFYFGEQGQKIIDNTTTSYGASYSTNDVIGVAFNLDDDEITFYKNGSSQGTITTKTFTGAYKLAVGHGSSSGSTSYILNAGARAFAYAAPSGFKALCTTNLPTPTIADGSEYFDVVEYSGSGWPSTTNPSQSITGLSFSPDFVWAKAKNATYPHGLFDTVRGVNRQLRSNGANAESVGSGTSASLVSFDSDGFSLGPDGGAGSINYGNGEYVAWTWDAGSSTVSNTDGDVTSSVRANQTAGFSIVKWNPSSNGQSVGHGLNAVPEFIMAKALDNGHSWRVYHKDLSSGKNLLLDTDQNEQTYSADIDTVSSTVFDGSQGLTGSSLNNNIAYCFTSVAGYSAFGSYTANGSIDGPFVHTGFAVAWLMTKRADHSASWEIHDLRRPGYNPQDERLLADSSTTEVSGNNVDFLSNGFKIRNTFSGMNNTSGDTYIYAAFAENPFQANGGLAR